VHQLDVFFHIQRSKSYEYCVYDVRMIELFHTADQSQPIHYQERQRQNLYSNAHDRQPGKLHHASNDSSFISRCSTKTAFDF